MSYRRILDLERRFSHMAKRMVDMKVTMGSSRSSGSCASYRRRRAAALVSGS